MKLRGTRQGAAMVEFAIVLPLLTLVAMGIIELANAWHREQVVATAAREGVRVGAQYNPARDRDTVVAAVKQFLNGGNVDTARVLIWTNCCATEDFDSVTVTDTLRFPVTSRFSPLPAKKAVTSIAVMRREK